ncbi:tellurite resistance/C4-dicarboxylate transporter family protein [Streptomyces sp. NPDC003077]|uniref:tellurite resistance/C4-dicarboxylate transporter family protein n=1 Tax=Streptomyces sp. NPDC003077 TaxID=3154443 RepID=UPI0033AD38D3
MPRSRGQGRGAAVGEAEGRAVRRTGDAVPVSGARPAGSHTSAPPPKDRFPPPAAGGAVMATGIVSVGLRTTGWPVASGVLLVVAVALWVALAGVFVWRLWRDVHRWRADADTPPALTGVAATTVLGTRLALTGARPVALALLALSVALWLVLLPSVVRHLRRRMPGAVFLVCVATQGPAVLGATLAPVPGTRWLTGTATGFFLLGVLLYVAVFPLFDARQVWTGTGDHWVVAGALAISALAGSKLLPVMDPHGAVRALPGAYGVVRVATLVLLALALAGYALLVWAEARRPRTTYDIRRWSTVFPLGMTAVACLSVAAVEAVPGLRVLGDVLLAVAVGAWCAVGAAALVDAAR